MVTQNQRTALVLSLFLVACGVPEGIEPGAPTDDAAPDTVAPSPLVACGLSTKWAGDEACLPDNGAQIHFGPSDYDDPASVAPFLLEPGTDATYTADAARTSMRFVSGYTANTRPGTHHLSVLARNAGTPDYNYRPYTTTLAGKNFLSLKKDGTHVSFSRPPEYTDAAVEVPPNLVSWVLDVHYINTSGETKLMEGWVNFDAAERPPVILAYFQLSGATSINVAPRTRSVTKTGGPACAPPQDVKLVSIGSHAHSHSQRVSVFVSGTLTYTNLDWEHPLRAAFDSTTENPLPTLSSTGALSGVLSISKGTPITWECDVDNDLSTPIRYGANLRTAEMCALAGFYTPPLPNNAAWGCTQP